MLGFDENSIEIENIKIMCELRLINIYHYIRIIDLYHNGWSKDHFNQNV
jgi:hypothetical protein